MDIKKKIGNRIRKLRTSKNISQLQSSNLANLDRTYIASVENGKRNISIINIEKIATALDILIKNIFEDINFD